MRLGRVATETGIEFVWRPFNVREIMVAQNNIPFANKPAKAAYMWRDVARRSDKYGLSPKLPAPYPIPARSLRVARQNPGETIVRASADAAATAVADQRRAAIALGIFGSPTFVVDGEVFWGG